MKPILKVVIPDKNAEATVNALFEDLYNRVIPSDTLNKIFRTGELDRPHISSMSAGSEYNYASISADCLVVENANIYCWAIQQSGIATWVEHFSTSNSIRIYPLFYNTTYSVRVRAIGLFGYNSDWSGTSVINTPVAPAPPALTGLTATPTFRSIFLEWPTLNFPDFFYYEIWRSTGFNDRSLAEKVGESKLTLYADMTGLVSNTNYYYWIRARNIYEQTSAWYPASATGGILATLLQVISAELLDAAVLSAKLAESAVITSKLAALAVDNSKLAALAVDAAKLANSAVTAEKIDNLAVGSAAIAALAVGTGHIQDVAIQSAKIGDLQVLEAKIGTGAVTEAKIGNLAVTNAKIGALAVDAAKIADLAVQTAKINDLAVGTIKVAGDAITYAKRQTTYSGSADLSTFDLLEPWRSKTITHSLGRNAIVQIAINGVTISPYTKLGYGLRTNGANSFVIQVGTSWAGAEGQTTVGWDYW